MLNSILLILSFLLLETGTNRTHSYPVQTYIYEDENCTIKVKTSLSASVDSLLSISLEVDSKKNEIFVFKDINQTDNYTRNILTLEYGGMFETNLDHPVKMIILNNGEKWDIKKKLDISKYNTDHLLRLSLSVGYIISKNKISNISYSSPIEFTVEKNIASISSIIIEDCLTRIDLGIFSLKLIR